MAFESDAGPFGGGYTGCANQLFEAVEVVFAEVEPELPFELAAGVELSEDFAGSLPDLPAVSAEFPLPEGLAEE